MANPKTSSRRSSPTVSIPVMAKERIESLCEATNCRSSVSTSSTASEVLTPPRSQHIDKNGGAFQDEVRMRRARHREGSAPLAEARGP